MKAFKVKLGDKEVSSTVCNCRKRLNEIVAELKEIDSNLEGIHEGFNIRHLDLKDFELGRFVDEIGWNSSTRSC